jgi:hypothetical protein
MPPAAVAVAEEVVSRNNRMDLVDFLLARRISSAGASIFESSLRLLLLPDH